MTKISELAVVSEGAKVHETAEIGPFAIVEEGARIGPGVKVWPHAYICGGATIGELSQIHMGAVVGHLPQDLAFNKNNKTYLTIGKRTENKRKTPLERKGKI